MNETPKTPEDNRAGDATPRKRNSAVLWLLLVVALLLLGWWWFGQRGAQESMPEQAPGTTVGEPAATAAAEAEKAAVEARKKKAAEAAKPRKPSKPAAPRVTEPQPIASASAQPDYPRDAQRRGQSGRVLLRVDVAADGSVANVDFVQRSGTPELDRAAMNAVRKWRFNPARRDGKAVASSVNVPIDFVLPANN
ncbi:energy transducer TonB [Luteimonas sp. SX5]|uniref:Energy transducer TonB n=1 Tax=Luteimonas galliterrae TaxID=2940486 RepID=A0ABT0MFU8_9GAMM|nr:energy transducer TonB [Luteimonas galliterrae]MCL1633548.1 energy transducer TonB [Luteimonas galliterrae]